MESVVTLPAAEDEVSMPVLAEILGKGEFARIYDRSIGRHSQQRHDSKGRIRGPPGSSLLPKRA